MRRCVGRMCVDFWRGLRQSSRARNCRRRHQRTDGCRTDFRTHVGNPRIRVRQRDYDICSWTNSGGQSARHIRRLRATTGLSRVLATWRRRRQRFLQPTSDSVAAGSTPAALDFDHLETTAACLAASRGHLTCVEPDERAMEAAAPPPHFMNSLAG